MADFKCWVPLRFTQPTQLKIRVLSEVEAPPPVMRRMGKAERAHQNTILEQMGTGDTLCPSYI